ncbi:MAG: S8 family serine peptidase [Turicibacter sp.]|nr:S8 family serine peptidase [Turicibacter sp.]
MKPFIKTLTPSDLQGVKQQIFFQAEQNTNQQIQGQLIIRFKDGITEAEKEFFFQEKGFYDSQQLFGSIYLVYLAGDQPLLNELYEINEHPLVLYAETNSTLSLAEIPADPLFANQWGLYNTGQESEIPGMPNIPVQPGIDIGVLGAWDVTKGSPDVTVGIIDSGVSIGHTEFHGRIDEINLTPGELNTSHGTHVAGIIGAAENGVGIVGVAPRVKLLSLAIIGHHGNLASSLAAAIQSMVLAAEQGIKICNISWTFTGYFMSLRETMENLPILFCCAAGNMAQNMDTTLMSPPSFNLENQITVANLTAAGVLEYRNPTGHFGLGSNFGPQTVALAAPGTRIFSTTPNGYGFSTGTSFAAPFVAGVAALALSVNPGLSAVQLRKLIVDNTRPLTGLIGRVSTGGMLDAKRVVDAALVTVPVQPPVVDPPIFPNLPSNTVGFDGYIMNIISRLNNSSQLDVAPSNGNVILWTPGSQLNQRWRFTLDPSANSYTLQTLHENFSGNPYLAEKINTSGGFNQIGMTNILNNLARWVVTPADGNSYQIVNVATGNRLDVTNASTTNGTLIQTHPGNSTNAQRWSFHVISQGPPLPSPSPTPPPPNSSLAPTNISIIETTTDSVTLGWNPPIAPVTIKSYDIFRNHQGIANVSGNTLAYTDSGLAPGTEHHYYVTVNANSAFSNQETVTTPPSATIPNHYTFRFLGSGTSRMLSITNHGSATVPKGWSLQFNVTGLAVTTHAPAVTVTASHGQQLTTTVNAPLPAFGTLVIPVRTVAGNPNISNIRVNGLSAISN